MWLRHREVIELKRAQHGFLGTLSAARQSAFPFLAICAKLAKTKSCSPMRRTPWSSPLRCKGKTFLSTPLSRPKRFIAKAILEDIVSSKGLYGILLISVLHGQNCAIVVIRMNIGFTEFTIWGPSVRDLHLSPEKSLLEHTYSEWPCMYHSATQTVGVPRLAWNCIRSKQVVGDLGFVHPNDCCCVDCLFFISGWCWLLDPTRWCVWAYGLTPHFSCSYSRACQDCWPAWRKGFRSRRLA